MAIFKSDVYQKNIRLRPDSQVEPAEATITITVPAGTALAAQDLFYFCKVGENIDVTSVDFTADPTDDNANATTAGSLGFVAYNVAKTYAAVVTGAADGYASIWPTTTEIAGNSGTGINIQKHAGGGTAGAFNTNPFPVNSVVTDMVFALVTAPATAITDTDRRFTVRVKYQYAYPSRVISGVTDSEYPLDGTISYSQPQTYDYNGNAP